MIWFVFAGLLWPAYKCLSVRSKWQGESEKVLIDRTKRSTAAATLASLRPSECVDEGLNMMFGDHYNPVHIKSALLGGQECRMKDFYFPKLNNLGSGGYGTVKTAIHLPTNQTFAVKSIIEMNPEWHKWIRAEECIQYGLSFPFITKHYCTMVHDWYAWLVLELVEGSTLRKLLQTRPVDIDAKKVVAQLITTIEYLQLNNIVMGDLTSANVMIDISRNVKIIDFGFALRRPNENTIVLNPTWNEGRTLPDFIANSYNDWFAIGKIIYEILVAMRPIECQSSTTEDEIENPNTPYRFGQTRSRSFPNCAWLSTDKLKIERCAALLNDSIACDLIAKFTAFVDVDNWHQTWGLSEESRTTIRSHAWFKNFDWSLFDRQTEPFMVRNNYNS